MGVLTKQGIMFRVMKLGWGYKLNIQLDDTLGSQCFNYSKEVSPCQMKEENQSSVLAPYKWSMLEGKYLSTKNGKDVIGL